MVDRKEDQSTQFRDTSSGNFEQAKNIVAQMQVDPSLADAQTVAQSLGVDLNTGLSQAEAKRRLDKYGPNELASAPPVPKWKKFLEQFKDPLVYLLAVRRHRHRADPHRQRGARLHSGIEGGSGRRSALQHDRAADQCAA